MISFWAKSQNWAKLTPWFGIITLILLFKFYSTTDPMFWALINIPLYMFHQTEEHYIPGGFKKFINHIILKLPENEEKLTDIKIFWINILLVWVAFLIFGILSFVHLGFGLLIIIFSLMNCFTHIFQGIKLRRWNPGLVVASIQFVISIYAAYFITVHGNINHIVAWWIITVMCSVLAHILLFKIVMSR